MTNSRATRNPERHARTIVKLKAVGPDRYVVHGASRAGMQFRPRHGVPGTLLDALDRDGAAFAFAYVDRNGRWRLQSLAPKQPW